MTKPFTEWKVLPRGKLVKIDDNILTVTGEIHMPLTEAGESWPYGCGTRFRASLMSRAKLRSTHHLESGTISRSS